MIINHNIAALNTHRQMGTAQSAQMDSMEKLSSGLRINSAKDDAAGLTISEKMRGQIRGLEQASTNAQSGISLIQTAEGTLNETQDILQRMRELAVQSANDTNTDTDRTEIQKEVDQLSQEISRIGNDTEFNTKGLLDGSFKATFQIGANENQNLSISINDMRGFSLGMTGNSEIEVSGTVASGADTTAQLKDGKYTIDGTNLKDSAGTVVATTADSGGVWTGNGATAFGDDTITFTQKVDSGSITISANGTKATGVAEFSNTKGLEAGKYSISVANHTLSDENGIVIGKTTDDTTFKSLDGTKDLLVLDAAATADTTVTVGGIDVSSRQSASASITKINAAIETVSSERSKLGATQNRLDHTINNLNTSSENLTAAESRIRDVDYAEAA